MHGDLPIARVRIAGLRLVHHDDVLARPDSREAQSVGPPRDRLDHLASSTRAYPEGVQTESHLAHPPIATSAHRIEVSSGTHG